MTTADAVKTLSRMRNIFARMQGMTIAEADAYVDGKLKAIGRGDKFTARTNAGVGSY